jgi:hypothetical protein
VEQDFQSFKSRSHLFLIGFSNLLTICAYLCLTWRFFPYSPNSGWAVFLAPRSYGGTNDLPSSSFRQWRELTLILIALVIYFRFFHFKINSFSLRKYLISSYFLTFLVTFGFVLITSNGIYQYVIQAKSVNNGIVYSIGHLLELPQFLNVGLVEKIQYIFVSLGSNDSGYTIPGTTHPPASFLIFIAIAGLAKVLAFGSSEIPHLMIAWTLVITLINCLIIPLILAIIKEVYGETTARRSLYYLLCIPSITFHVCAMTEIIGSISFLSAIYLSIKLIRVLNENRTTSRQVHLLFMGVGTCFVIQAQISYSQLIPIFCFGITLVPIIFRSQFHIILLRIFFLTFPYFAYSFLEFGVSGGQSFYVTRAFEFAQLVDSGLQEARPNPQSQFANWVIISTFGGLLFLSTIFTLWRNSITVFKGYWQVRTPQKYLEASTLLASVILVFNTAAHMEVERIWHWFFAPVWILASAIVANLYKFKFYINSREYNLGSTIVFLQLITTLILAMIIQDYY